MGILRHRARDQDDEGPETPRMWSGVLGRRGEPGSRSSGSRKPGLEAYSAVC